MNWNWDCIARLKGSINMAVKSFEIYFVCMCVCLCVFTDTVIAIFYASIWRSFGSQNDITYKNMERAVFLMCNEAYSFLLVNNHNIKKNNWHYGKYRINLTVPHKCTQREM